MATSRFSFLFAAATSMIATTLAFHSTARIMTSHRQVAQRPFAPQSLHYIDEVFSAEETPAIRLPSLEQVRADSFTEQTFYANTLLHQLVAGSDQTDQSLALQELMTAQLSHRDGMRGFLAVYLTKEESPVDLEKMPSSLTQAMKSVDMAQLAPLACMNVIRPAAMASWHTDPVLQANSNKTAQRAKKFLSSLRGSMNVLQNIQAVYAVATGSVNKDTTQNYMEQFWETVFHESGYDPAQRKAIAAAFASFVTEQ